MPLINIEYGSLASSEVMNDNFEYLDNRITTVANNITTASSSIYSNIASLNSNFTQQYETLSSDLSSLTSYAEAIRTDFDSQNLTPDYSKAVTVCNTSGSGSHNIDWNGWLAFDLYCNHNSARYQFFIDDVMVGATASDEGDRAAGIVMVNSGSVASWNGSQSIIIQKVPYVGG